MSFSDQSGAQPRRINVHNHHMPPALVEPMKKAKLGHPAQSGWTPQQAIDDMDKAGIGLSVLSVPIPAVSFLPKDDARRLARECNDYAMTLMADHPGRFGSFATLPMPYVDETLKEIEYALDTLKMDGVCLLTSYRDRWLGDPSFDPVMDDLNRRGVVTFVHPNLPTCCSVTLPMIPPSMVEYGADTARAITNLLFTGTSMRCRNVKFIFTHAGGAMPMFIDRYATLSTSNPRYAAFTPNKVFAELRRFHYDTALAANAPAIAALGQITPVSQILLGTDFPYRPSDYQVAGLQRLFSPEEMRAVERENALHVMPRLPTI
ncbi:MAG: 6-methylsalicylate decarboxylase [Alphaproteobacteria bacterium]|nr:6-methylsalicylate decarboxylase [Alphaproteobacteria bacterium]